MGLLGYLIPGVLASIAVAWAMGVCMALSLDGSLRPGGQSPPVGMVATTGLALGMLGIYWGEQARLAALSVLGPSLLSLLASAIVALLPFAWIGLVASRTREESDVTRSAFVSLSRFAGLVVALAFALCVVFPGEFSRLPLGFFHYRMTR